MKLAISLKLKVITLSYLTEFYMIKPRAPESYSVRGGKI